MFRLRALALGAFVAAAAAVFLYFLHLSGARLLPANAYRVRATVPNAVQLAAHADVRQAGVRIGEVTGIRTRGDSAVLSLAIEHRYAPVYGNATVLIRNKDLAGENYVDLQPGAPPARPLRSGAALPASAAPESTQVDQILSSLDAPRRRDVRRLLDALGAGLGGRGSDLNRFVDGGSSLVRDSAPVNAVLAADREQVAALIDDFGRVAQALGDRGADIRTFARRSRVVATAVAARDRSLRATLAALPGFLRTAGPVTRRLGAFATSATPVVADLRAATQRLTPAMTALEPATRATRATMTALGGFARRATPLMDRLRGLSAVAVPFAKPFEAFLRELNPLSAYLEPYARELGTVFTDMRAVTDPYDATGHYARIMGLVGKSALVGVVTPQQEQALKALEKAGAIAPLSDTRGINPYPVPGGAADPRPGAGGYPRLQADPPYQRISADPRTAASRRRAR